MSYRFKGSKIIINGKEQVIVPSPLPNLPTDGVYVIDEIDGKFKVYNENKNRWLILGDAEDIIFDNSTNGFISTNVQDAIEEIQSSPKGSLDTYSFSEGSSAKNKWLEYESSSIPSDETPAILPFDCKLIACTFTNKRKDAETDIRVHKSLENNGNSSTVAATFEVRGKRVARFSNFSPISFSAGDKVSVYLKDRGVNVKQVVVKLYFLIETYTKENSGENYGNDISLNIGGITVTIG